MGVMFLLFLAIETVVFIMNIVKSNSTDYTFSICTHLLKLTLFKIFIG